jgi:dolichol-phosphate mannosyltransferase
MTLLSGRADRTPTATIVLPTYNEVENLPRILDALVALRAGIRILVVDDNSPDGTGAAADALAAVHHGVVEVLHRADKTGLADAYLAGIRHALARGAERVVLMDADFSHPVEAVPRLLALAETHDVAVGSRYVAGGGVDARWSPVRRLLSRGASHYARLVVGLRVRDATAGFKCFRREALERLSIDSVKTRGYGFHVEVALRCHRAGLRVAEHPIYFRERDAGASKMTLGIALEAAWRLWQLRFSVDRAHSPAAPDRVATSERAAERHAPPQPRRASVSAQEVVAR